MSPRDISEAPPHVQATMRAYAAFNARDLDAAVPELDEAKTCMTREQVRVRLARLLAAFSDLSVSGLRAYELPAGRVAVRFVLSGTNDGALDDSVPATGRRVQAEMLDVVQFDQTGRVIDARNLSDLGPIRRQLGRGDG